jgi:hypothetical protein
MMEKSGELAQTHIDIPVESSCVSNEEDTRKDKGGSASQ